MSGHSNNSHSIVTIGVFDGVHRGHQALITQTLHLVQSHGCIPTALTFDPHPAQVLNAHMAPALLEPVETRKRRLQEQGIQNVTVQPFDIPFSQLSAQQFIENVLIRQLNARAVVIGEGFVFGHRQQGDVKMLTEAGQSTNRPETQRFSVHPVAAVKIDGVTVSSTKIRGLIQAGQVQAAGTLLGRAYGLDGIIVSGAQRGRTIGVPTLNLKSDDGLLKPALGVYISRIYIQSAWRCGITNIGYHPTFEKQGLKIETHVLDETLPELYGETAELQLLQRLRDERRFESVETLVEQIRADIQQAKAWHRSANEHA